MSKSNNIFLIGPMGAGKTTIGRQIARKLQLTFYDSDNEIEKRTGADIPLIFEIENESGFRKRESQIIAELVQLENIVLSTGGGAVLNIENRKKLAGNGRIYYLKTSPEQLYKRTVNDKRRPLLQTDDRLEQIKNILSEREPVYESLADKIIDTNNLGLKQIVNLIIDNIKNNENS